MNEPVAGRLIEGDVWPRDAMHMAMAAVVADEKLSPGEHVGFIRDSKERVASTLINKFVSPIGIADPFLRGVVLPGQRFWMWLYPKTITGLAHHWSHPSFDGEDKNV